MRVACLYVPSFALAAWYRTDPELRGAPLAVVEGEGPRARVVACSPEAKRRGAAVGMSAAQARSVHAEMLLRRASRDAERAAQAALRDAAHSFSPRVEDAGGGTVYLDLGGTDALHESENDLARALVARARILALDASVGVASSKIAARLTASDGDGIAVIPPHEEWRFLAPLPVRLLSPGPALQETFARWGIRRLGDLAALPASAVATRLGPEGAALARRARGEDACPLVPEPVPLEFEESTELEYGIETLEPFLFVVRALLDRLIARIEVRGLVCGDLRLSLGLVNGGRDERTVSVAAPGNEAKSLLALVRVHLESHPPAEPVETIRLAVVPEKLRPAQLDMFRPNGPAPTRLAVTLARLTALCGADHIGAPAVADSHRPEAYGLRPFGPGGGGQSPYGDCPPRLAVRALRPARALEVFCDQGRPDFVRLAETWRGDPSPYRCNGRVVTLAGPWRIEGEWWRTGDLSRDYYDVQLSDGAVYRIFFDSLRQQWFVDGVYD